MISGSKSEYSRRLRTPVFALIISAVELGCSTLVNHQNVESIRSIAVVSLYANQFIQNITYDKASSEKIDLLRVSALIVTGESKENDSRQDLINYALQRYSAALTQVPGWVVSNQRLINSSRTYQAFWNSSRDIYRSLASVNSFNLFDYSAPKGMGIIHIQDRTPSDPSVQRLVKLCNDLQVDAVAVVHVDLAIENAQLSERDAEAPFASVQSSLQVLTKNGEFAVAFPEPTRSLRRRHRSERPITLANRKPSLSSETVAAFKQAIDIDAEYVTKKIVQSVNY